jgi:hypothetical protein
MHMLTPAILAIIVVLSFLTLVAGVAAGLFGGMWWQARKTAEVWEKTYTHVREQKGFIGPDTYNTASLDAARPARPHKPREHVNFDEFDPPEVPTANERVRVRMQADVRPSADATRWASDDEPDAH